MQEFSLLSNVISVQAEKSQNCEHLQNICNNQYSGVSLFTIFRTVSVIALIMSNTVVATPLVRLILWNILHIIPMFTSLWSTT